MYFLLALALWGCIVYILKRDKFLREKSQNERKAWFEKANEDHDKFIELYSASKRRLSAVQHLVYSNAAVSMAMNYRIENEAGVKPTDDMAIRALLAQGCKMPNSTAYSGFRSSPCGKTDMEIERKFLMWYDKELRIHGFPYKLLFVPWHKKDKFKSGDITVAVPVTENPEITSGVYFWEPIRAFASGGDNIVTQENTLVEQFFC